MALPLFFYAHVADTLARLCCTPPRAYAHVTDPLPLGFARGCGSAARLRSGQRLGPAFQPRTMTACEGCLISISATLAFFYRASMINAVAGIRRTVRKAPIYAG